MEKMNRRVFCGTSFLALPLMGVFAGEKENRVCSNIPDPITDVLADEFAKTTFDGARNGFGAGHFRQYAGYVRIFDAHLHAEGTNKKLDNKMDEDDYHLLDQDRTVRSTAEYWKKHGVLINENILRDHISFDMDSYGSMKKTIKKMGGVQILHERVAEALERKARETETVVFRGGPVIRNGNVIFPAVGNPLHQLKPVDLQLDVHSFIGIDLDCLCKAMAVEGSILALLCVLGCVPCCAPSAVLLALETLMGSVGFCDPTLC